MSRTLRNGHSQSRDAVQHRYDQHRPQVSLELSPRATFLVRYLMSYDVAQNLGSVLDITDHVMINEDSDHVLDPRVNVSEYNMSPPS